MSESALQGKITKYLRSKGCYVLVTTAAPGIPNGCPDIVALLDGGGWICLEVKASPRARFQPLQKATIKKLDEMYYCKVVHPGNWDEVKKELESML